MAHEEFTIANKHSRAKPKKLAKDDLIKQYSAALYAWGSGGYRSLVLVSNAQTGARLTSTYVTGTDVTNA